MKIRKKRRQWKNYTIYRFRKIFILHGKLSKMENNIPNIVRIFSYVKGDHREIFEKVSLIPIFSESLMKYPPKNLYDSICSNIRQSKNLDLRKPYVQEWVKKYMLEARLLSMIYICAKNLSKKLEKILCSDTYDKFYYYIFFDYKNLPDIHVSKSRYSSDMTTTFHLLRYNSTTCKYNFDQEELDKMRNVFINYCIEWKRKVFDFKFQQYTEICGKYSFSSFFKQSRSIHCLLRGDTSNRNILHSCCFFSYYPDDLIEKIDFSKALNEIDQKGYTPLHYAILTGDFDAIIYLIKKGANFFEKIGKKSPYALFMSILKQNFNNESMKNIIIKNFMHVSECFDVKNYYEEKRKTEYFFGNFRYREIFNRGGRGRLRIGCRYPKECSFEIMNRCSHCKFRFIYQERIKYYVFNDKIEHPINYNRFFVTRRDKEKYQKILDGLEKFYSIQ